MKITLKAIKLQFLLKHERILKAINCNANILQHEKTFKANYQNLNAGSQNYCNTTLKETLTEPYIIDKI